MNSKHLTAMAGAICTASLLANTALADGTVTSLSDIQGQWEGQVEVGGFAGFLELELGVTEAGAILDVQRMTLSCEYAIAPNGTDGVFAAFLVQDRNNNCQNDQIIFATVDGQLGIRLIEQWQGVGQLAQTNGPATGERIFPDAAIKGVTIGTPLSQLNSAVTEGGTITPEQSSRRVIQGVRQLNGTYRQISVPYSEPDFGSFSQDNMAFYKVPDDANEGVMAITRFYAPSPLQTPSFASFEAALVETYGPPAATEGSGRYVEYHWHFGLDGQPATGTALDSCTRNIRSSADGRVTAMLFSSLKFYASGRADKGKGVISPKLQPRPGCGYSLEYILRSNDDGSLENAEAVFFDHRALATEMWADASEDLREEVEQRLARINAAATNAPDL